MKTPEIVIRRPPLQLIDPLILRAMIQRQKRIWPVRSRTDAEIAAFNARPGVEFQDKDLVKARRPPLAVFLCDVDRGF